MENKLLFPVKNVPWETVRNIANSLTNQLYLGKEIKLSQAHVSNFSGGPARFFTLEEEKTGTWKEVEGMGGWWAFDEEDIRKICWKSMTSENSLQATKVAPGKWELIYLPGTDPEYRGFYYKMYEVPEKVENLEESYVNS